MYHTVFVTSMIEGEWNPIKSSTAYKNYYKNNFTITKATTSYTV